MGNDHRLNLVSSILLTLLSAAILLGSARIHSSAGEPLYASPALMPGMLGVVLLVTSLLLLWQSVRGDGLGTRLTEVRVWIVEVARHPDTRTTLVGLLLMGIYTFVLVHVFQFWAATLIFTIAMLFFLRATRWYWVLAIAGGSVTVIVLLFSIVFNIPLP